MSNQKAHGASAASAHRDVAPGRKGVPPKAALSPHRSQSPFASEQPAEKDTAFHAQVIPFPVAPGEAVLSEIVSEPERNLGFLDPAERMRTLVRLAQDQGYLTYSDVEEAHPEPDFSPEQFEEVCLKLRGMEVEIVDQAEVDRLKPPEPEDESKGQPGGQDDPVRTYLREIGQVSLLNREQEVAISKRIEEAETAMRRVIYGFGFAGKEHLALADKLLCDPPKERFDRVIVDKKIESRENHLRALRRLVQRARALDKQVDDAYAAWRAAGPAPREKLWAAFRRLDQQLQAAFPSFTTSKRRLRKSLSWRQTFTTKSTPAWATPPAWNRGASPRCRRRSSIPGSKNSARWRISYACPRGITSAPSSNCSTPPPARFRLKPKWWKPIFASSSPSPSAIRIAASPSSI